MEELLILQNIYIDHVTIWLELKNILAAKIQQQLLEPWNGTAVQVPAPQKLPIPGFLAAEDFDQGIGFGFYLNCSWVTRNHSKY